jgi:hypothetical protein
MPVDNLVAWLSQGPLFLFAIIIWCIVSIDVFVVELTRDYGRDKEAFLNGGWTPRMRWMALWHALFHSLSFFLYIVFIYGVQGLAFLPIDVLDLPDGVGLGLLTVINFVIICFIWWTYKGKIVEDHSDKSDDSATVGRRDMKVFVDLVRAVAHRLQIGDRARGVAIAGSVAVDMLAISALLKIYLLPNGDAPPISSFFGIVLLDVLLFAIIIFFVVLFWVFAAQAIGSAWRSLKLIVLLRFAEPFAVFFILAGTVRAVMQLSFESYGDELSKYGVVADLLFATAVVISLVVANGRGWKSLLHIYASRNADSESHNPLITNAELRSSLKSMVPAMCGLFGSLAVVVSALAYAYSTIPGRESHNHLIEATGLVSVFVLLSTLVFMYLPSRRLDVWETQASGIMKGANRLDSTRYWFSLAGAFLALASLNAFNVVVFGRSFEVDAIVLWSVYLLLTWLLFNLRSWRFRKALDVRGTSRCIDDANFSEFISALGTVSAVIALAAIVIVTALKGTV